MTPIDILPCVLEEGNVRRPYPGEAPEFYGAHLKDADGLSEHVVDFYCMDEGSGMPDERYTMVLWLESDDKMPNFIVFNALGAIQYCGDMHKNYRDIHLTADGSVSVDKRVVAYDSLPDPVQRQIRLECLRHVEQPVTA